MSSEKAAAREYYKRNLVFWGLFAAYIPGLLLIGAPLARVFGLGNEMGIVALAWLAGVAVVGMWRLNFRCPRCNNRFYYKGWYKNTFTTKCVHCGFRPAKT